MPYITIMRKHSENIPSLQDFLLGNVDWGFENRSLPTSATITRLVPEVSPRMIDAANIGAMVERLKGFCEKHDELIQKDKPKLYIRFYIPKKTGGLREINAPIPELMDAQRELRTMFEEFGALYHTAAFAYVKGRSTVDAIKRHQQAESRWFYKSDFSNFFGNTTPEFLKSMLSMVFPFSEILKRDDGSEAYDRAISLCFLNGGLPQGTPISPMLTNLMMIPIDHRIANDLYKLGYTYTRYADDILISHKFDFEPQKTTTYLRDVLRGFGAPYDLKREKTRYGSSAGRNWNLGVMLNGNNDITVGWRDKKRFRAMLHNFMTDYDRGVHWDRHDIYVVLGKFSYYLMIEPDYFKGLVAHLDKKCGADIISIMKKELSACEGGSTIGLE